MGRRAKIGLDFWIRDIGLFRDPKLRRPRQEFGVLGPYVYECLLDIAYSDKGYFIDYSGEGRDNTLWLLSEMTSGRYAVTVETLANVIDCLVACGLFSGDLYERGFVTSKRMQQGYFTATLGRTAVQINFDIWLLSEDEMRELNPSGKSFVLQSFISWQEKHVSRQENTISGQESTQRREEKSIEEKSIEEKSREHADALTADLEKLIGAAIDNNFRLDIARLLRTGMQDKVVLAAARHTASRHPRDAAPYFRTILRSYERDGIMTEADLDAVQPKQAVRYDEPPSGELTDDEKRWLENRALIRERRLAAEQQDRDESRTEGDGQKG